MQPENVLSVTQLTREIREVLQGHIGTVWVEGEISNHRLQGSGHQYFTLKDAGSQLSCVMFRGAARSGVRLGDGVQVMVQGDISVYEPRGQYQMVVKQVQMKGQGGLQAKFEALKRKLYEEGFFDQEHKQSIPKYPRVVALVTSPTGAAIQDMLNILTRRAPWIHVLIFPVRVQGQGVEKETIRALEMLNAAAQHGLPVPDTIVIGRGGGSIEDLWAYNEETLARAIFASRIPIISAVGHEIDFTIADFVADLRAPTPSAAAELLAPDVTELKRHFDALSRRLTGQLTVQLDQHEKVLDFMRRGGLRTEPVRQLQSAEQEVDEAEYRLKDAVREQLRARMDEVSERQQVIAAHHPQVMLTEITHRLENQGQHLRQSLSHRLARLEDRVSSRADVLKNLGPESILARGFSYTTDVQGKVIKSAEEIRAGDLLVTRLQQGVVKSIAQP
ncbi:exodeoxyribonuclease VII large subunit [Prosthecobacter fusiformis]|uniref:Exodeoxyribonuclease 7 large subunit n=1 Tax=Prosthecobacter fusiformis TaxID=48464 RepID=A0A4R7RNK2_9BACT|nr:exodeoxyribonuclease VII large subunit [Prosthecobacter fusiformis]TDU64624.1 exodeoxyribonuclease VII large subunit [Prosthecobacter fusiformis]